MNYAQEDKQHKQIDITACLDAVSMYDAAYHRDRDNYGTVVEQQIVSLATYMWNAARKASSSLLGQVLLMAAVIEAGLIFANVARNIFDVGRAQPTPYEHEVIDVITKLPHSYTTWIPSKYPFPADYINTNLIIYEALAVGIVACCAGSRLSLKRAEKINVGIPISHADTAHLPARESLVRASSEPARETLVRATSLPPTPPSLLLRSVCPSREVPAEQLVRPAKGDD